MRFLLAATLLCIPGSLAAQDAAQDVEPPIEFVVPEPLSSEPAVPQVPEDDEIEVREPAIIAPPAPPPPIIRVNEAVTGLDAGRPTDPDAPEPIPAIWTTADDDTTLYFFGTIHALPEGFAWRNDTLDEVIEKSDTLYLEIAEDGFDILRFVGMLGRIGINLDHPTIRQRIDPDLHDEFDAVLEELPIPESGFDNLDSWLAAILIYEFTTDDYADSTGADETLELIFSEAGKPIRSLEDGIAHYGFFDTLSEEAQRAFLEAMLSDDEEEADVFNQMIADWVAGNVEAMADDDWFDDVDPAVVAEFDKAILDDRNANWVTIIKDVLANEEGTFLIAGGAAHFAGENSVIDMLEKQGFEVRRIQ